MAPRSLEYVLDYISYDRRAGQFHWIKPFGLRPSQKVGAVVHTRTTKSGQRTFYFAGDEYSVSKLAWFAIHGEWLPPQKCLLHLNDDQADDRISNLIPGSRRKVNGRQRKMPKKFTSDYKGVSFHRKMGLWRACLRIDRKTILSRYCRSEIEAARAYDRAARQHLGLFARPNFPAGGFERSVASRRPLI